MSGFVPKLPSVAADAVAAMMRVADGRAGSADPDRVCVAFRALAHSGNADLSKIARFGAMLAARLLLGSKP